jgi:hypothetical protein
VSRNPVGVPTLFLVDIRRSSQLVKGGGGRREEEREELAGRRKTMMPSLMADGFYYLDYL